MRIRATTLAIAAALAMSATPAQAHEGDPNFRSEVTDLDPAVPGLEVGVTNYDDSLHAVNDTDQTLLVRGYSDEPYVRVLADGRVEVNQLSPSYWINQDRYAQAEVPDSADADAAPDWREVNRSGEYTWHDHRIHWMGEGLPPQVSDPDEPVTVSDWSVPVELGGTPVEIEGTLRWVGSPGGGGGVMPLALGGAGALVLLGGGVLIARRRSQRQPSGADPTESW